MRPIFFALCLFFSICPAILWADDPVQIGVTDKKLDAFFDLPLSFHQVTDTNVIFSKKVKGADHVKDDKVVGLDVERITRSVLVDQFTKVKDDRFTISGDAQGDSIQITPLLFMRVLDDGRVLPWTVWNIECRDLYWNKKKWEGECFCCMSGARPLEGPGSWTADGGEALRKAVEADARELVDATKNEVKGVYKGTAFHSGDLKASWIGETKSKKIHVNYIETGTGAVMIRSYDDNSLTTFLGGGLTGLLLKSLFPNSILFNGSLILAKGDLEPIVLSPTPVASPKTSK